MNKSLIKCYVRLIKSRSKCLDVGNACVEIFSFKRPKLLKKLRFVFYRFTELGFLKILSVRQGMLNENIFYGGLGRNIE